MQLLLRKVDFGKPKSNGVRIAKELHISTVSVE